MEDKAVVITGGAQGIGLAIGQMMAGRGARLALLDIEEDKLAKTVADFEKEGQKAVGIHADIRTGENCHRAFTEAIDTYGRIHILCNIAGVYTRKPLLEINDDEWNEMLGVNVRGLYHMTVAAFQHMKDRGGGKIVNIASVDAWIPYPSNAHYGASKAAVVSLTRSFALEGAPHQIFVNSVSPAATKTENVQRMSWLPELEAKIPLGYAAEPSDIAETVCFLAGDRNRFITGENLIASGGFIMV